MSGQDDTARTVSAALTIGSTSCPNPRNRPRHCHRSSMRRWHIPRRPGAALDAILAHNEQTLPSSDDTPLADGRVQQGPRTLARVRRCPHAVTAGQAGLQPRMRRSAGITSSARPDHGPTK